MPLANRNPLRNPTLGSYLYGFTPGDISTPGARKDSLFLAFDLLGIIFPTATLSLNSYKYISANTPEANPDIEGYFRIYPNEIRINKSNIDSQNNRDEIIEFLNSDETTRIIFRDDRAQIIGYYFITFAEEEEHHILLEISEIAYENSISPFQDNQIYSIELGYAAVSGKYVNTSLAPETIGGFLAGEPITPPEGLTQKQFNDKLFASVVFPTATMISFNLTLERGSNYSQPFTIVYNQNDAGIATNFILEENGIPVVGFTNGDTWSTGDLLQVKTVQGKVEHEAGDIISAGTVSTNLYTFTPKLRVWANSTSVIPTNSTEVRSLGGSTAYADANTVTIVTGTTNTIFVVAIPTSVNNSATLQAQDTTNNVGYEFTFDSAINVVLPNGDLEEYRIYKLTVDNSFGASANIEINL